MRYGLLSEDTSFFDYGCGRGDDIDTLNSGNISASGWDPHYAPENKVSSADIVNLGYVLNVIEDQSERLEALKRAWKLTQKVLSVAVMTPSAAALENARPYKDGFLTSRATFQKYYSQHQLNEYIQETLNVDPIPVAPGIFFVFKDDILKQTFLITRFDQTSYKTTVARGVREKATKKSTPTKLDRAKDLLNELTEEIESLGRIVNGRELSREFSDALKAERIALNTAQIHCLENLVDKAELERTSEARRADLTLYFALELFNARKAYRELPIKLQQDLKSFWGSYANAQIEARNLLFSIGSQEKILEAVEAASADGLGYMLPENQFQFHISALAQLPLILRCYVACGSVLYGEIETADIIKLHVDTAKLSLQFFENFDDPLPIMLRGVKIDRRSQRVRVFDYSEDKNYLFMKSLFLPEDHPFYQAQTTLDKQILKISEFDFSLYGPDAKTFDNFLTDRNLLFQTFN